jgi:hypothetical protein
VYCLADTIFPEGSAAEGLLSRGYVSREKHVPPPSGLHAMKEGTDVEIEVRGKVFATLKSVLAAPARSRFSWRISSARPRWRT